MKEDSFYRAFEDRHRGSRELIKERLRVYLPLINPLKDIYGECSVLDLGCGRGEWLELTGEAGFKAHGVDLDEGMLAACRERGFSVETQDAVEALRSLPDESQSVISGFHLAEHLHFAALKELVKEALRVLKPAGLLILETPNPENIIVGTSNFYLDPTHQRPLPPLLLAFLPEHAGFSRTKIVRLQEAFGLANASTINLLDVLSGVSPDYSVIAQKRAQEDWIERFNSAFEHEYGLTLEALATKYELGIQRRFSKFENELEIIKTQAAPGELSELKQRFLHAQQSSAALDAQLRDQQREVMNWLREALAQQQKRADLLAAQLAQAQSELASHGHELQAIYASRSWRITRPLRLGALGLRWLFGRAASRIVAPPLTQPQQPRPQAELSPAPAPAMQDRQNPSAVTPEAVAPTPELDTEAARRMLRQLHMARSASTKGRP
ncbi:Methyltransferase type 11 (modular protein) [Thiomonas sp. X19]|uniref:class I SAM-dependent methyltransferase n=1 Tax=Thiomonas sp. X19 TaxID=1050370 RepID=UPI000B666BEC|nr:class I SAM-dependent methyltransferase [Thiomonas sp. X19]SCC93038.1 Methyltransferase type 11 (modular protein) [Thiomonas sp. X19]